MAAESEFLAGDPSRGSGVDGAAGSPTCGLRARSDFGDVLLLPANFKLPAGDAGKGQKLFKQHCAHCHSIYPEDSRIVWTGAPLLGPTLFDIYGRTSSEADYVYPKTTLDGRATGLVWTAGHLMNYMKNPRQAVSGGVQMDFGGIDDFQSRVDIIHYLKTLNSDNEELAHKPERPASVGQR